MLTPSSGQSHPTVGVVAICYNEERDLPGFFDSLLPWVDEIVLVDDGSTDATHQQAKAHPEKVKLVVAPRGEGEYYSHQRNKGIAAATSDWLLHMDVDERVTPALAEEIRVAVQSSSTDAYRFRRRNYFLNRPMRGGGWQTWNQIHLAHRDSLSFSGMYHEACEVACPEERIGQLAEPMWHLNDDTYAERMSKSMRYCEEQAICIAGKHPKLNGWHLVMLPLIEFARKYIGKMGFRDGTPGLLWALHSAGATQRACSLAWDQQNRQSRASVEITIKDKWSSKRP